MTRKNPTLIRNRTYGTVFRIIRTVAIGDSLYWVGRNVHEDGSEDRGTSRLSVDLWAMGEWEVVTA